MARLRSGLRRGTLSASRRSFIRKTSVVLSVPIAAAAVVVPVGAESSGDSLDQRLARLEDVNAIRALNETFARQVNAGEAEALGIDPGIRNVVSGDFGERDTIQVAPDRQTATSLMHCTVHIERAIGPSCPLVEMAREQGGGVVRRSETGVFEHVYARRDGRWAIEQSRYRST
jgi:hypothetical protein